MLFRYLIVDDVMCINYTLNHFRLNMNSEQDVLIFLEKQFGRHQIVLNILERLRRIKLDLENKIESHLPIQGKLQYLPSIPSNV
jgi:hypothetical protein